MFPTKSGDVSSAHLLQFSSTLNFSKHKTRKLKHIKNISKLNKQILYWRWMFNSKRYFSSFSTVKYWSSKKTISNKSITAPFTANVPGREFPCWSSETKGWATETGHGAWKWIKKAATHSSGLARHLVNLYFSAPIHSSCSHPPHSWYNGIDRIQEMYEWKEGLSLHYFPITAIVSKHHHFFIPVLYFDSIYI